MPRAWLSRAPNRFRAPAWASECAAVCFWRLLVVLPQTRAAMTFSFEVSLGKDFRVQPQDGRLFLVLAQTYKPEPRLLLDRSGKNAPQVLARDVTGFGPGASVTLDEGAFSFPATNLA